jgi:hypothetical protein
VISIWINGRVVDALEVCFFLIVYGFRGCVVVDWLFDIWLFGIVKCDE